MIIFISLLSIVLVFTLVLSIFARYLYISDKKKNGNFRNMISPGTKVYVSIIQSNFEGVVIDSDEEYITVTTKVKKGQIYPTKIKN